jgi:predicted phosphodiesterase
MKKVLQKIFTPLFGWLAERFASDPEQAKVNASLSRLFRSILKQPGKEGMVIDFDWQKDRFIIFSDQHKGAKNQADDFAKAEKNYLTAMTHYYEAGYFFINLGDSEELWENMPDKVIAANTASIEVEERFHRGSRMAKIFGNHDLFWHTNLNAKSMLKKMHPGDLRIHEGLILRSRGNDGHGWLFFLTHGHQGDTQSDGNRFSKWFVANVWAPVQSYLDININSPAKNFTLRDKHNIMMYEWSCLREQLVLITGHTHKPVFASYDHIDKLKKELAQALKDGKTHSAAVIQQELDKRLAEYGGKQEDHTMKKPSYFNTGCCCYSDGDITGIEIAEGCIRLIKWEYAGIDSKRLVLQEAKLPDIFGAL